MDDMLFLWYRGMVEQVVGALCRKSPALRREMDDLLSEGMMGLLAAIGKRKPGLGDEKFQRFAQKYIRGYILEYVRKRIWGGRSRRGCGRPVMLSYDQADGLKDCLKSVACPVNGLVEKSLPHEILCGLDSQEVFVIRARYELGWKLRKTGECLGVSESRACQIHRRALKKIARKRGGVLHRTGIKMAKKVGQEKGGSAEIMPNPGNPGRK